MVIQMKRVELKTKANTVRLFLDSGAYSAWSRGEDIDIKEYIRFCHENKHLIHCMANLDVIPGKFGRRENTQSELDESAKASYRNQQIMKDAGLAPIPVFHQGESIHWLEQMLRDGETYIGLSPSKFVRLDEQMRWLDMVFNILTNEDGVPFVATHGFAATSFALITSYPWRSVDSTTWCLTPGYGQIIFPSDDHRGGFDYRRATRVIMSGILQQGKSAQQKQYENLPDDVRATLDRFITEEVGSTIALQRHFPVERCKAMLTYYLRLNERLYGVRHARNGVLFGPDHLDIRRHLKPCKPWNMIQYFVTAIENYEWSKLMTDLGANDRLLSYWVLKDKPNQIIEHFVTTGLSLREKPPLRRKRVVRRRSRETSEEERIALAHESMKVGANIAKIAQREGVSVFMLGRWRRKYIPNADMILLWRNEVYLNKRRRALLNRNESYQKREKEDGAQ